MSRPILPTRPDPTQFANHVEALRQRLHDLAEPTSPEELAERTGATLLNDAAEGTFFTLRFWGQEVTLSYPDWQIRAGQTRQALSPPNQALLLYYFITADGTNEPARWISFAELPDGRFYNQAFQGYTGAELARGYQDDPAGFVAAAVHHGGQRLAPDPYTPGDLAFRFQVLPKLAVLVVYWSGDEDFSTSVQVLFESCTPHYLPTDVCAYLGSSLTRMLLKP